VIVAYTCPGDDTLLLEFGVGILVSCSSVSEPRTGNTQSVTLVLGLICVRLPILYTVFYLPDQKLGAVLA